MNNSNDLIKLSKIFKEGYTVQLKNGKINQYTNYNKPFIVSYKTLIKITGDNMPTYTNINLIPDNCIIGGWFDNDANIYYIELNKAFKDRDEALIFAIQHNQKAIYDIKANKTITKYKGVKLWITIYYTT